MNKKYYDNLFSQAKTLLKLVSLQCYQKEKPLDIEDFRYGDLFLRLNNMNSDLEKNNFIIYHKPINLHQVYHNLQVLEIQMKFKLDPVLFFDPYNSNALLLDTLSNMITDINIVIYDKYERMKQTVESIKGALGQSNTQENKLSEIQLQLRQADKLLNNQQVSYLSDSQTANKEYVFDEILSKLFPCQHKMLQEQINSFINRASSYSFLNQTNLNSQNKQNKKNQQHNKSYQGCQILGEQLVSFQDFVKGFIEFKHKLYSNYMDKVCKNQLDIIKFQQQGSILFGQKEQANNFSQETIKSRQKKELIKLQQELNKQQLLQSQNQQLLQNSNCNSNIKDSTLNSLPTPQMRQQPSSHILHNQQQRLGLTQVPNQHKSNNNVSGMGIVAFNQFENKDQISQSDIIQTQQKMIEKQQNQIITPIIEQQIKQSDIPKLEIQKQVLQIQETQVLQSENIENYKIKNQIEQELVLKQDHYHNGSSKQLPQSQAKIEKEQLNLIDQTPQEFHQFIIQEQQYVVQNKQKIDIFTIEEAYKKKELEFLYNCVNERVQNLYMKLKRENEINKSSIFQKQDFGELNIFTDVYFEISQQQKQINEQEQQSNSMIVDGSQQIYQGRPYQSKPKGRFKFGNVYAKSPKRIIDDQDKQIKSIHEKQINQLSETDIDNKTKL